MYAALATVGRTVLAVLRDLRDGKDSRRPRRGGGPRQAVPLPTQTISSPSTRTIASFPPLNVQLPLVKLFPSQRRPSLRPENHRLFLVPQRTIATRQAVPLPTQTISSPSTRTIASFPSLNVQLPLVKLFPFQRRPSLRPAHVP
jgi:hypothetical protein